MKSLLTPTSLIKRIVCTVCFTPGCSCNFFEGRDVSVLPTERKEFVLRWPLAISKSLTA